MNQARMEIFELISNTENKMGIPLGLLSSIYDLEESVVHLHQRQRKRIDVQIKKVISEFINNSDNVKQRSTQPSSSSDA